MSFDEDRKLLPHSREEYDDKPALRIAFANGRMPVRQHVWIFATFAQALIIIVLAGWIWASPQDRTVRDQVLYCELC